MVSSNSVSVPSFMYGTAWKKEATHKLVVQAIEAGFRAIDTANQLKHYDEVLVGSALQEVYKNGIKREDLFLQTKFTSIDGQDHRLPYDPKAPLAKQVKQSIESSLAHLHTDYVDSYVLHGPYTRNGLSSKDWEVWGAIEELYESGLAKAIGVSNVTDEQVELLCAKARIKPMFVQNRCYAVTGWDYEVRQLCREHKVVYQGFSLLTANVRELSSSTVHEIAHRHNATIAQCVFRFCMELGMLPLTGTTDKKHMSEDLLSSKVVLTNEEVATLERIGAR